MPSFPTRFTRHGRVLIAADRTHLVHADATPFFYLADTAWNGALLSTENDWTTYLTDRASKGFTAIQFITQAPWAGALTNLEGQSALEDNATINDAFFDRIDRRIDQINAAGLLAVPVLAWAANFGPSSRLNVGHTAPPAQLIPLLRYQVDRFARHHVLWLLAGDGVYNFWRARKWKRIARAVFADTAPPIADPADHQLASSRSPRAPVALHPAGLSWPYRHFRNEQWLDLYGYQSSHSEHPRTLRWLQSGPPAQPKWNRHRPTINLEPVYEGIAPGRAPAFDNAAVRRAAYWSLLNAPTAGVAYGAHGLWSWNATPAEPLNHPGTGVAPPWHVAMHLPGSHDMRRLAECFTSIRWWTLRPDPTLLPPQRPGPDYIAAARSDAGDLAVLYLPSGGSVTVNATHLDPELTANWFNPRTAEHVRAARTGDTYAAPDRNDWLLFLTAPV